MFGHQALLQDLAAGTGTAAGASGASGAAAGGAVAVASGDSPPAGGLSPKNHPDLAGVIPRAVIDIFDELDRIERIKAAPAA